MPLLRSVLADFKDASVSNYQNEKIVKVPRYDKSLRAGRGDRSKPELWTSIQKSDVDIVLFEGWMLGFTAKAHQNSSKSIIRRKYCTDIWLR